jgi:hypothetical protein
MRPELHHFAFDGHQKLVDNTRRFDRVNRCDPWTAFVAVQVSAFDAVDRSFSTSRRFGVHPSGEVLVPTLSVVSSGTRHPFKNRLSILNQPIISS